MTREKLAACLFSLLIGISAWNIHQIRSLNREIESQLQRAEQAALCSEFDAAGNSLNKALTLWLKAESYTHIFIRHPEIDSCTDAFYEALESISSKSPEESCVSIVKLRYHIESIAAMERISPGSVF